ncbi:steroid receptor RNA activator 1 [Maniola hyperantus]|uniref:steroid receptor RNA activator 1 n=1 Tax=Aphantopus hyperantus TaxID=2795564 RepID=UPI001567DE0D|nr:steroid receptor RNA activator 1-like [Maniola hyperantus]
MENCENTANNKVSFDPGWNDPPSFAYNASQTTTPNRPRNFLNKRVAFPLSGNSTTIPPPMINLPPLPTTILPPVQIAPLEPNSQDDIQIDSENVLKEVKDILLEFLESSSELGSKAESIKKKIGIMEEMWLSGKLNKQIQIQMKDLACALRDDNPTKADYIHKALMVDHVSFISTWMPGVKQLIYHCIARSELLAIDKE